MKCAACVGQFEMAMGHDKQPAFHGAVKNTANVERLFRAISHFGFVNMFLPLCQIDVERWFVIQTHHVVERFFAVFESDFVSRLNSQCFGNEHEVFLIHQECFGFTIFFLGKCAVLGGRDEFDDRFR